MVFVLILTSILGSAFIASEARAAEPINIVLPCDRIPFPSCAALKERLLNGTAKEAGFGTLVQTLIDGGPGDKSDPNRLQGIYDGKVDARGADDGMGGRTASQILGKPPFCLPIPISEHGCTNEFQQNFRPLLNAGQQHETCSPISKVGQVSPDKYYYSLGRSHSGSLETAQMAGVFAVAISNQAREIGAEIALNKLVISGSSACYVRAQEFMKALKAQTDVKLLEKVPVCDVVNGQENCSTRKYFDSGFSTLQVDYLMLAKCRMIQEAAQKTLIFGLDYPTKIENEVLKPCHNRYRGYPDQMRKCYGVEYGNWIKARARAQFPLVAQACSGQNASNSSLGSGFGLSVSSESSVRN